MLEMLLALSVLIALTAATRLVLGKLGIKRWSVCLAVAHLAVVLYVAWQAYKYLHEAQVQMVWFPLLILDFPVSLLGGYARNLFLSASRASYLVEVVIMPGLYYATIGTLQYFVLGHYFDRRIKQ
jgi:hypothetical protein